MTFEEYIKEDLLIGFMEGFPVLETLETQTLTATGYSRHFPTEIKVSLAKVGFGKDNEFQCRAVITERVDTASTRPMHGWGSCCHIDEGKFMEKAVVKFCELNDLIICKKICSWPFAKAIVTDKI